MNTPRPARPAAARSPRRAAFTLIELLTVIAIIGILAAILIPTIGKVRSSARAATCASNLRQVGVAVNLYVQDNRDLLPGPLFNGQTAQVFQETNGNYPGSLASRIARYLRQQPNNNSQIADVMICPGAQQQQADPAGLGNTYWLANHHHGTTRDYSGWGKLNVSQPKRYSQVMSDLAPSREWALMDYDRPLASLPPPDSVYNSASTSIVPEVAHGSFRNALMWDFSVQRRATPGP